MTDLRKSAEEYIRNLQLDFVEKNTTPEVRGELITVHYFSILFTSLLVQVLL